MHKKCQVLIKDPNQVKTSATTRLRHWHYAPFWCIDSLINLFMHHFGAKPQNHAPFWCIVAFFTSFSSFYFLFFFTLIARSSEQN